MNAGHGHFWFPPLFLINEVAVQIVGLRKSQSLAVFLKFNLKDRPINSLELIELSSMNKLV